MSEYLPDSHSRSHRSVIVLAEDDEDTRRVYGIILRHYGYVVEEAQDGLEAIEVVRKTKPDLVLMDVNLPGLDGHRASRALKADPATCAIPILAFSGDIGSTADLPTDVGAFDGYILKPISPSELVRRVATYLIRRESQGLHSIGQTGEVEIPRLQRGHYDITA
jgi:CheY-like chemotaxis protein